MHSRRTRRSHGRCPWGSGGRIDDDVVDDDGVVVSAMGDHVAASW
jgi:hypothetical protein